MHKKINSINKDVIDILSWYKRTRIGINNGENTYIIPNESIISFEGKEIRVLRGAGSPQNLSESELSNSKLIENLTVGKKNF